MTTGSYLGRYLAGEHRAVWTELGALGDRVYEPAIAAEARAVDAATMATFVANVEAIAAVLKKAKYKLSEKKAVRPPKRDLIRSIAALAKIVGPLPISLVAFYEACDGVSLAQDVDATIDDSPVFGEGVLADLALRGAVDALYKSDLAADPALRSRFDEMVARARSITR